jgi:hypothetical protein
MGMAIPPALQTAQSRKLIRNRKSLAMVLIISPKKEVAESSRDAKFRVLHKFWQYTKSFSYIKLSTHILSPIDLLKRKNEQKYLEYYDLNADKWWQEGEY